jgi:hypothetical protein
MHPRKRGKFATQNGIAPKGYRLAGSDSMLSLNAPYVDQDAKVRPANTQAELDKVNRIVIDLVVKDTGQTWKDVTQKMQTGKYFSPTQAKEFGLIDRIDQCTLDRPWPMFCIGQHVRVILNDRSRTPHIGTVREIIWHVKDQRYNYYLEENGKKVSKRYFDSNLEGVE